MSEGDVVLTPLPQADGRPKIRPAIVLRRMPPFGDLLLCGVSAQVQNEVIGFDQPIKSTDADFLTSGLKAPSLIRLGFLATLPVSNLFGGMVIMAFHPRPKIQFYLQIRVFDILKPVIIIAE